MKLSDVQEGWLQDLESGKFKQGTGYLKTDRGFCCIGVACQRILEDDPITYVECDPYTVYQYQGLISNAPKEVVEKLGLYDEFGGPKPKYSEIEGAWRDRLATLNDTGYTFKQIAAIIRKNPEKYLKDMKND